MSSRLATRSRCDPGSKAMLPMCVPRLRTCALTDGGAPAALMTKRSMSASVYGVNAFQERFNSSTQLEPFQLTMRPVLGAAGSDGFIAGFGGGMPPFAATSDCDTMVVWLPDSKTETKTREPSLLRASARGCLPKIWIACMLPGVGLDASRNTLTAPFAPVMVLKPPTVCV